VDILFILQIKLKLLYMCWNCIAKNSWKAGMVWTVWKFPMSIKKIWDVGAAVLTTGYFTTGNFDTGYFTTGKFHHRTISPPCPFHHQEIPPPFTFYHQED
jgi:hypothetical protein